MVWRVLVSNLLLLISCLFYEHVPTFNHALSAQLHCKQSASAPLVIVCRTLSTSGFDVGQLKRFIRMYVGEVSTSIFLLSSLKLNF